MKITQKYLMIGLEILLTIAMMSVLSIPTQAELPPRPTITPVPDTAPHGATIILQTQVNLWTVVQWQDTNNDWHDVEGWRGAATDGTVKWWVAQKDFGTGPFRWVVSKTKDEKIIATSQAFYLPSMANEIVSIAIP